MHPPPPRPTHKIQVLIYVDPQRMKHLDIFGQTSTGGIPSKWNIYCIWETCTGGIFVKVGTTYV